MSKQKQHLIIILLILVLSVPTWFMLMWHRTMYGPMYLSQGPTSIKVYPGHTVRDIGNELYTRGLIRHPHAFVFAVRLTGKGKRLRFGEYHITPGMNASALLSNIMSGKGLVKHQITFVEGWTFKDIIRALNSDKDLFHHLSGKSFVEVMAAIGYPGKHPEGLFLPETYTFTWGNTDIEVLQKAFRSMKEYLDQQWEQRDEGLFYKTVYQALIVASLIERETSIDSERPMIASVILNRIKKRMRLQVDPTVLYGLNKPFSTEITRNDLKSNTPYNTYKNYGLPPTPIGMPSRASIYAALHPAKTNYLYYVAKGDGTHIFSETYKEHLQAVKKYRDWLKQQEEEN